MQAGNRVVNCTLYTETAPTYHGPLGKRPVQVKVDRGRNPPKKYSIYSVNAQRWLGID
jgi:hypothetical protein